MRSLAETLLGKLPPEAAHRATLRALRLGLGRGADIEGEGGLTLFGKQVPNRIGLSGGADKDAAALAGWARLGFGFVEAGTVTVNPRKGNPEPRIWRVGNDSVVNAMGLPNQGIEAFARNLAAYRATAGGMARCVGASVASPDGKAGEMRRLATTLGAHVDFLTLNASCPNTEHETPDLSGILAQVAELRGGAPGAPVLVKLGPTQALGTLDRMVDAFLEAGVAGFVACNTATEAVRGILGAHAPGAWPTRDGKPLGGYSGPGLLETSLAMVERLRGRAGRSATVIGVGGVQSGKDLAEMMAAGADAVEVYTVVARHGTAALDALRRQDALMRREAPGLRQAA